MWLLAHYKVPLDEKLRTFDNHGRGMGGQAGDQISFTAVPTRADEALARRFRKLSPGQVAMCRGHLESIIIQYIGWNSSELNKAKKDKVAELNKWHGKGFGDALWKECHDHLLSLFDKETLALPESTWKNLIK